MCGIVEIHKNNVIHRDLKPENIFIDYHPDTPHGRPTAKIGDFGLARMLGQGEKVGHHSPHKPQSPQRTKESTSSRDPSQTNASRFSSVAGTEIYMAPEIYNHYL